MKSLCFFVATAPLLYGAAAIAAEDGSPRARRVVVAGPEDDVIAARVQKELTALGFETVRVGSLDGCARSAVVVAALDHAAVAATCSDSDQVGVWVADGNSLRLRDVVVVREEGERERETVAVRAAEVTRATIALREAEESNAAQAVTETPVMKPRPSGLDEFDRPPAAPASKAGHRRTALFSASAGMSALMGVDASVGAFSAQVAVGVLESIAATARLEFPVESQRMTRSFSAVDVAPAFAGVGAELPILRPSSFIIPRLGAGLGIAWINATRPESVTQDDQFQIVGTTTEGTDSVASLGAYASAGLSMRLVGPLRVGVDGVFGSTFSRLVVRDQGRNVAFWGQPLGALALRIEVMIP